MTGDRFYWPDQWISTTASTTDIWPTWTQTTGTVSWDETWTANQRRLDRFYIWPQWVANQQYTQPTAYTASWHISPQAQEPPARRLPETTPEVLRARQLSRRRADVRAVRARVAKRRATELLLGCLTDEQRADWEASKTFTVETADGKRTYRIREGLAGNVYCIRDDDDPRGPRSGYLRRFCMHVYHPDGSVPLADNVLAQKLLIEANEAEFLRQANLV